MKTTPQAHTLRFFAECYSTFPSHARTTAAAYAKRQARRNERRFLNSLDLDTPVVHPNEVLPLTGQDAQQAFDAAVAFERYMLSLGEYEDEDGYYECDEADFATPVDSGFYEADYDEGADLADEVEDALADFAYENAGWGDTFDPADVQWGFTVRTRP